MMSFPLLLGLLSLIIIIPAIFIGIEKSRQAKKQLYRKHQHYLHQTTKKQLHQTNPALAIADSLNNYRYKNLPSSLIAFLQTIKQQYLKLPRSDLSREQIFMVDNLLTKRVHDILNDYLSLDSHYAQSVIIDKANKLTSLNLTEQQLAKISSFLSRINLDGQKQRANNILANQGYLNSVFNDFYPDFSNTDNIINAQHEQQIKKTELPLPSTTTLVHLESVKADKSMGLSYLHRCFAFDASSQLIETFDLATSEVIGKLDELLHLATQLLDYDDSHHVNPEIIKGFDTLLSHQLPQFMRVLMQNSLHHPSSHSATTHIIINMVSSEITHISQLLKEYLNDIQTSQMSNPNTTTQEQLNSYHAKKLVAYRQRLNALTQSSSTE